MIYKLTNLILAITIIITLGTIPCSLYAMDETVVLFNEELSTETMPSPQNDTQVVADSNSEELIDEETAETKALINEELSTETMPSPQGERIYRCRCDGMDVCFVLTFAVAFALTQIPVILHLIKTAH